MRLGNGHVLLVSNSQFGKHYGLDASTNLHDWVRLQTLLATDCPLPFTDTNAPAFPRRFYRITQIDP